MRLNECAPRDCISSPVEVSSSSLSRPSCASHASKRRCHTAWFAALLFVCASMLAQSVLAQEHEYKSIVVFGDSLSDTGNDTDLVLAKYYIAVPGPYADYTYGRFTDGADTYPAARNFFGVWIEQLADRLPGRPAVIASLNGGTNYAYGFATTGDGTGVFTLNDSGTEYVTVNNVGLQITDYLATHPKIDDDTLFVVWAGAINVLYATSTDDVIEGALEDAGDVLRLVHAGATHVIVPNLPPLGLVPRLNGSPTESAAATGASELYNQTLSEGLDVVSALEFFRHPHLYRMDVFSLFESVVASASSYGLDDVTKMSQGVLTVNPDKYLFWDDLHPTTHGHHILALDALSLVEPSECAVDPVCTMVAASATASAR